VRAIAQWTCGYTYSIPLDLRRRQDPEPVLPPKNTPKGSFFDHADTHGIKRLQRLCKVEAEVRSTDAIVRTMRG
jgi:hypothetical protein